MVTKGSTSGVVVVWSSHSGAEGPSVAGMAGDSCSAAFASDVPFSRSTANSNKMPTKKNSAMDRMPIRLESNYCPTKPKTAGPKTAANLPDNPKKPKNSAFL